MDKLKITNRQNFMGKDIPVVLGGFGTDKKCLSDKTISEIHDMEVRNIRARITDNIKRFNESIDFIDLKDVAYEASNNLLYELGYTQMQISKAEHIYVLSERGYAKLIKIMDSDLAWEIHDKLIDEYFQIREMTNDLSELSPQLQLLINMELKQKQLETDLIETNTRIDNIKEVVSLDSTAWRSDTQNLLNKIAISLGGTSTFFRQLRTESYELLDRRMGTSLQVRLTNKRRRMADEGISKSKRDALTKMDVIADDKKLIEGYVAVVKDMAIKHGIADKKIS